MPELINNPITSQHTLDDRYGNGFSKANGCAWIAAYNVMLLTGNPMESEAVKKALTDSGGLIFRGTFGTNPRAVYTFLKQRLNEHYSVKIKYSASKKGIEAFASDCDIVIITSFWYSSARGNIFSALKTSNAAAHTFAGRKVGAAQFEFYNETYHNKVTCSIQDLFKSKSDRAHYRWSFPVCIISIKSER
ncbi:MAG: hypothetical protein ACYC5K_03400 [Saccharofermentanales bacterium]